MLLKANNGKKNGYFDLSRSIFCDAPSNGSYKSFFGGFHGMFGDTETGVVLDMELSVKSFYLTYCTELYINNIRYTFYTEKSNSLFTILTYYIGDNEDNKQIFYVRRDFPSSSLYFVDNTGFYGFADRKYSVKLGSTVLTGKYRVLFLGCFFLVMFEDFTPYFVGACENIEGYSVSCKVICIITPTAELARVALMKGLD